MARLALTPILAAAPTFASAFSDQDFCSAARQFAAAIERDVGIWVDRKVGTEVPWFTILGAVLGMAGGFISFFRVVLGSSRKRNGS